jgi:hypothetical protein
MVGGKPLRGQVRLSVFALVRLHPLVYREVTAMQQLWPAQI